MDLFAITPTRNFNLLYIILDSFFILFFLTILIMKKRYLTTIWSIFGGILYFVVDFGYFYYLSHARTIMIDGIIQNASMTGFILFWMSMSYGITNFAFIWLCLKKDRHLKEFLFLIIGWWLIAPTISSLGGEANIQTYRTTGQYHGAMAIILLIGYFGLILYNLFTKKNKVPLLKLNLIGFFVQFSWEFALLINQIRPMNENSLTTLLIDSLIETNLGMPYIFLIYIGISKFYNDNLQKVGDNNANDER